MVGWDCDRLFCLGWVVCINRTEFSGVVWSVLVGLGLLCLMVVSGVGVGYSFFFGVVGCVFWVFDLLGCLSWLWY